MPDKGNRVENGDQAAELTLIRILHALESKEHFPKAMLLFCLFLSCQPLK